MSKWSDKEYMACRMREYRKENPDRIKAIDLKRRFGITFEYYYELLEQQNNVCAICGKHETALDHRSGLPRALAVDHCHRTGNVRGLLCTKCNRALGMLQDDVSVVKSAYEYLQSFHCVIGK